MESDYLVFSASWQSRVKASDSYDAALKATKFNFESKGELFTIAHVVVVVNEKGDLYSFESAMVLEDLGRYHEANLVKNYLKKSP